MDAMDADRIVQCWFRFLHVLSNPVDLSRSHVIMNTQQFLQASLTSSDVPAIHQVECLRQLPAIFYRAMRCVATIVDAFLGKLNYQIYAIVFVCLWFLFWDVAKRLDGNSVHL